MKNGELYVMRDGLSEVPDDLYYEDEDKKGIANFKMAVSKNKRDLQNYLKDLEEAIKPSEKFQEYQKEEQECSKKHCRKDEDGKNITLPSLEGGRRSERFDIIGVDDPESDYFKEFKKLEKKYKEEIEKRRKQIREFNDVLDEESKFKPYEISMDLVPKNLPQKAMDAIFFMVDFDSVPKTIRQKKGKTKKK